MYVRDPQIQVVEEWTILRLQVFLRGEKDLRKLTRTVRNDLKAFNVTDNTDKKKLNDKIVLNLTEGKHKIHVGDRS